ncbi:CAP domain-containing protein [Methylobacterium haplocladii]|uniref:SCP domain-containing protein n=1 Tax=Methylobacterium haplocladii TaxID=1176176 RepID=A0A512ISZ6_9HYPH|nr:CAP domain-containing protein [Methylobacterium haplocladii]GEP00801.1 hypothetical protein MHA02_31880 [Methylobacterium haplocladii]GJD83137.1 hypothetical protein HPGCJGGD_0999 [Methylobacterium haplocladii]GLS59305.1 hypothetical protein GCM10007887_19710 [Methylobacterium haplocladii]
MPKSRTARSLITAAILTGLALGGCGSGTPLLDGVGPTSDVILDAGAAAAAISRYRAQHGLGPVAIDSRLIKAASYEAAANARAGLLSHDHGGSFETRMASAGFGRKYTAENLSAGSETFDQVLGRWKASSAHNSNMLMPQARRIGIARVDAPGSRYKRYWALVLAGD